MTYAFLEPAKGPEDLPGVMLYHIDDSGRTPCVAWWPSAASYFNGDEGIAIFDGMTRENVEREYPGIAVFHDRHSAMQAWMLRKHYPNVMRLYTYAINALLENLEDWHTAYGEHLPPSALDQLAYEANRGRHWLFGASEVACGKESELAWTAHKVFT